MVAPFLIALLATGGAPDRGYEVAVPDGYRYEPEMSKTLATDLLDNRHYDGLASDVGADAYVSDGGAIYVTWIYATEPSPQPALVVRRAFDEIRATPFGTGDRIKAAEFVSWNESVTADLAVARLEWMHRSNETRTLVHTAMYVTDAGTVRQVRIECVMHADSTATVRPVCDKAFGSLSITTPRAPLGTVQSAGRIAVSDPSDTSDEDSADGVAPDTPRPTIATTPTIGAPQDGVIYRQMPEPDGRRDDAGNNLLYIGGGMLLLVAIYMATRRLSGQSNAPDQPHEGEE